MTDSFFTNQILDDVFNCERIRNYIYTMHKLRLINRDEVFEIELKLRELNTYDTFIYEDGPPYWMDKDDPEADEDKREAKRYSRIKTSTYARIQTHKLKKKSLKRVKPDDKS